MYLAENPAQAGGDGVAAVDCAQVEAAAEPQAESAGEDISRTKAFSERLNQKTDALQKRISEYEKRESELAERLKQAGLPGELSQAAQAVIESRTLFSGPEGERDLALLGGEDARRALADGSAEKRLRELLDKPVALRSHRDRACYEALKSALETQKGRRQLAALGVDCNRLAADPGYAAFCENLDQKLSEPQKYALYRRYAAPDSAPQVVSPPPVSGGSTESGRDYFTPEQVDAMTRSEVDRNLPKILASMTKWGRKTR